MTDLQAYLGRTESHRDIAESGRMKRLAALLDHVSPPWPSSFLPPLGHWLCFLPSDRQSNMGEDGHPRRTDSGLLPNVELPRRMWAGNRIKFLADIPLDVSITRKSTLIAATPKTGRSGKMLFATVRHEITAEGSETGIVEEQDIVYREAAPLNTPFARATAHPDDVDPVVRAVTPDPLLLFRYSALTFNGHRIHYDRDYARNAEGYPALVVHGPLIATLMLDHLLRELGSPIQSYSFRAVAPSFDGETIQLGFRRDGADVQLRAIGPEGLVMTGMAELAS